MSPSPETAKVYECPVCLNGYDPGPEYNLICPTCTRSMRRANTGDDLSVIVWAAKRARTFERRRRKS